MSTKLETRVDPSDISQEELKNLFQVIDGGGQAVLIDADGNRLPLPKALNDLFLSIAQAIKRKEIVFLMHEDEAFTTQAAANFLGISRQHFVRILESGEIEYHHVGTHRRVLYKNLLEYRNKRSRLRKEKIDEITDMVVSAGLEDTTVDLTRIE